MRRGCGRSQGKGGGLEKCPYVHTTLSPKLGPFNHRKVRAVGDFVSGEWRPTYDLRSRLGYLCRYPLHHLLHHRLQSKRFATVQVEIPVHGTLCRKHLNRQSRTCLRIYAPGSKGWSCGAYQWKALGCVCSLGVRLPAAGTSKEKKRHSAIPLR